MFSVFTLASSLARQASFALTEPMVSPDLMVVSPHWQGLGMAVERSSTEATRIFNYHLDRDTISAADRPEDLCMGQTSWGADPSLGSFHHEAGWLFQT
jgi:hypothetical protein